MNYILSKVKRFNYYLLLTPTEYNVFYLYNNQLFKKIEERQAQMVKTIFC